jgi:hypothetical protein
MTHSPRRARFTVATIYSIYDELLADPELKLGSGCFGAGDKALFIVVLNVVKLQKQLV